MPSSMRMAALPESTNPTRATPRTRREPGRNGLRPTGRIDGRTDPLTIDGEHLEASERNARDFGGLGRRDHFQRGKVTALWRRRSEKHWTGSRSAVAPRDEHATSDPNLPGVEASTPASSPTDNGRPARVLDVAAVDEGAAAFELRGSTMSRPPERYSSSLPAQCTPELAMPGGDRYRVLYLEPERCWDESALSIRPRPTPDAPVVVRHPELAARSTRLHATLESPGIALEQGELLNSAIVALSDLLSEKQRRTPMRHRSGPRRLTTLTPTSSRISRSTISQARRE